MKRRMIFLLGAGFISFVLSATSASAMLSRVRVVDVLSLFAGGFASGVTLMSAVVSYRLSRGGGVMPDQE